MTDAEENPLELDARDSVALRRLIDEVCGPGPSGYNRTYSRSLHDAGYNRVYHRHNR